MNIINRYIFFVFISSCNSDHGRWENNNFSNAKVIVTDVVTAFLHAEISGDNLIPTKNNNQIIFVAPNADYSNPVIDGWGNLIEVSRISGDIWVIRSASYDQVFGNEDDIAFYVDKNKNTLVSSHKIKKGEGAKRGLSKNS